MIVPVCLNPALDLTYGVDALRPGVSHRVRDVGERAGGKGANVARVAHALGADVHLLGLRGGATGERFAALLAADGVPATLVEICAATRHTVTVVDTSTSDATAFNEPGPSVTAAEWDAVLAAAADVIVTDAVVVLSGSVPPGCPPDAYARLTTLAHGVGARVLLDADGPALVAGLAAAPDVVKINSSEAAGLLGRTVSDRVGARLAADALRARGAATAIVSLGGAGLVAVTDGQAVHVRVPPVAGNPTGAGDALAAGLADGLVRGTPWPDLLADAAALAAAAVTSPVAGHVPSDVAATVRPAVVVKEI